MQYFMHFMSFVSMFGAMFRKLTITGTENNATIKVEIRPTERHGDAK